MITINELGEIIWDIWAVQPAFQELKAGHLADYDWLQRTYVTWPTSVGKVESVLSFISRFDLKLSSRAERLLEKPGQLVEYFSLNRLALSRAESYPARLSPQLRERLTPFQQAGAAYAAHTRSCFIADDEPEDRRAAALGAIHQVSGYPAVIVCRKAERTLWEAQARSILPAEVAFFKLTRVNAQTPISSLWFVDYDELHQNISLSPDAPLYRSVVVDHAHFIKNQNTQRSQWVSTLTHRVPYRFLLTKFPMDISPKDLLEPIIILGRRAEFGELLGLLRQASRDPSDNRFSFRGKYLGHLEALYYKLRSTCLVRRGDDYGLPVQRHIERIELSEMPASIDPADVQSDWHRLGLQKVTGAIAWLRKFLEKEHGLVLVIAHHNHVVAEISRELGLPAIYGKLVDKPRRDELAQAFLSGSGNPVLLVAGDVEFPWKMRAVSAVVLVELLLTPQGLSKLLDKISDPETFRVLPIYFLLSPSLLDWEALERLKLRLTDNARAVDGKQISA